jgi:hypothetical protein
LANKALVYALPKEKWMACGKDIVKWQFKPKEDIHTMKFNELGLAKY